MSKTFKYKVGDRFGSWTLLKYSGNSKWLARCSCGAEKECFIDHLSSGKSTQCQSCYGISKRTAAFYYKKEFRTWSSMLGRCNNPNNDRYHQYGGRGITVCDEWKKFERFLADMGPRPEGTSLDRIDVDGPYCKENCRWATPKQQMRNRRITKNNVIGKAITELAEETGLTYSALQARLNRGWSLDRAVSEPVHDKNNSLSAKARKAGLPEGTVLSRVKRGWSIEKALTTPVG